MAEQRTATTIEHQLITVEIAAKPGTRIVDQNAKR